MRMLVVLWRNAAFQRVLQVAVQIGPRRLVGSSLVQVAPGGAAEWRISAELRGARVFEICAELGDTCEGARASEICAELGDTCEGARAYEICPELGDSRGGEISAELRAAYHSRICDGIIQSA